MKIPLITSIASLPPLLKASVTPEEKACIKKLSGANSLPLAVTPHFASLAGPHPDDPLRRQFMPSRNEFDPDAFALEDPLGEARYRKTPRLVHQYRDRALLLAGGSCAGYCRFCFRRLRMSGRPGFINRTEIAEACTYLERHSEIREILISGGDPLTADNAALEQLMTALAKARPGVVLRICSRTPVTWPQRFSGETISLFAKHKPLRIMVHINHLRELEEEGGVSSGQILKTLVEAGIPVHVQTVLLKGINDDAKTLAALFRACIDLGLNPYYLFQLDLAPGSAHFRVPLKTGLKIYRELGSLVSGLALPSYAVDLPGGGGKIRLHDNVIVREEERPAGNVYLLADAGGKLWEYPIN
jgi:lysine 2,3-aminomutase